MFSDAQGVGVGEGVGSGQDSSSQVSPVVMVAKHCVSLLGPKFLFAATTSAGITVLENR
jgi:hypothetical protein